MKAILLLLLGASSLAGSLAVHATPITYQFTVNGGPSGPLAGETASGSFTFNSSIIPSGGGYVDQTGLFSALSFTWDGISFNQTSANTAELGFDSGGVLNFALFGTNCSVRGCGLPGKSEWVFLVGPSGFLNPGFAYSLSTVGVTYEGAAEIPALQPPPPPVPEPGTVALFGLGAMLILIRCRAAACKN